MEKDIAGLTIDIDVKVNKGTADVFAEKIQAVADARRALDEALDSLGKNILQNVQLEAREESGPAAGGGIMDIYRDGFYDKKTQEMFEAVENALGFKLFFWQKSYIATGNFRCYGATTAEVLKMLLDIENEPIDYTKPARSQIEKVFRDDLKKIQYRLAASGIKTRRVFWSQAEKRKYYEDLRMAEAAGKQERSVRNGAFLK